MEIKAAVREFGRLALRRIVQLLRQPIERGQLFGGAWIVGRIGRQPRCLQQKNVERLAGRARIGVADLLALEVRGRLDRRIRLHRPDEFGDGLHIVADDLEVGALLDRDHGRGRVDLAIGQQRIERQLQQFRIALVGLERSPIVGRGRVGVAVQIGLAGRKIGPRRSKPRLVVPGRLLRCP